MIKFMRNLIIVLVLVIASMIVFFMVLPSDENNIFGSLDDKHDYLIESNQKNIILIGGSSLLMGIDSQMMEDELDYRVTNMGIHAGLGLKFMLSDIKSYIKSGDIVVIAAEYSHYTGKLNGESALLNLFKQVPSAFKNISFEQIPILLGGIPEFLRGQLAGILKGMEADPILNRSNLNENGDLISHLDLGSKDITVSKSTLGNIDNEVIEVLNDFSNYVKSKGAKVVLTYPSLHEDAFDNWIQDIAMLDSLIKEKTDIEIISDYNNYRFWKDEIFDTIYHLNGRGRQRRTEQLIKDLKQYLNQS